MEVNLNYFQAQFAVDDHFLSDIHGVPNESLLDSPLIATGWPRDDGVGWPTFNNNDLQDMLDTFGRESISEILPIDSTGRLGLNTADNSPSWSHSSQPEGLEELTFDQKPDFSSQLFGFSGESDPFLLRNYPYDESGEVKFFRLIYRMASNTAAGPESDNTVPPEAQQGTSLAGAVPVYFLQNHSQTVSRSLQAVEKCLFDQGKCTPRIQLDNLRVPLLMVQRYFRYIFHALPVLSRSFVFRDIEAFVKNASVGLLAAIYALSLQFTAWDDVLCVDSGYTKPSTDDLWGISYACLQREMHFPRLSTIQTSLLLLNFDPFDPASAENPSAWVLASSTLAIAQSLGLNMNPIGWDLPTWEIRLRRRLWCWNVTPLTLADFEVNLNPGAGLGVGDVCPDYFMHLSSLTIIANNLCRTFFSLHSVYQQQPLNSLIDQARVFRQQLHQWIGALPESLQMPAPTQTHSETEEEPVDTRGSLHISYFTVQILLFRALLRPILDDKIPLDHLQPSVAAILDASRGLIRAVTRFIYSLDARHQSVFWPTYTRSCFSYPGQFSFMLCFQHREPHMMINDQKLLAVWRQTLRTRAPSWPLLRFAAIRVDGIFWKNLVNVAAASHTVDTST
ncbi:transcriptional regulator family: Fungal Specific TF [Penicillium robsamsonii]|uniref:transcriptional regulator family: Fungal Specific TF n=1 Tax=Penicillium robsamsonii TaxID=1792511 RepID=UPI0025481105|nr:transcriptional regulator family: Fungal Specific TF [Penicillium robsamsonii]KAJ5825088.1 transcriptional regulator family: Fungal Specific TF [Penicillium robsamsonii]